MVVHIRDERREPAYEAGEPVEVVVAGSYSARYRKAYDAQRDRLFKRPSFRTFQLTPDLLDRQQVELVAACILSWRGFTNGGQPFSCTPENAVMLLTAAPWIRRQLEDAMEDHAAFFEPRSPT